MCDCDDSIKFHIDKTYATLFEIGKRFTNSVGVSILLLSFTVVLTFGDIVGEEEINAAGDAIAAGKAAGDAIKNAAEKTAGDAIAAGKAVGDTIKNAAEKAAGGVLTLPFIGLKLRKLYVAEIAAVLTCASVYRTLSLVTYERLIRFRLERLLLDSNWDSVTWALEYPSVFYLARRISEIFETKGPTLIRLLAFIITAFCLVPLYCLYCLGGKSGFTPSVWIALILTILLIAATVYIYKTTPKLVERDATLDKLNKEAAPVKPEYIKISSKRSSS